MCLCCAWHNIINHNQYFIRASAIDNFSFIRNGTVPQYKMPSLSIQSNATASVRNMAEISFLNGDQKIFTFLAAFGLPPFWYDCTDDRLHCTWRRHNWTLVALVLYTMTTAGIFYYVQITELLRAETTVSTLLDTVRSMSTAYAYQTLIAVALRDRHQYAAYFNHLNALDYDIWQRLRRATAMRTGATDILVADWRLDLQLYADIGPDWDMVLWHVFVVIGHILRRLHPDGHWTGRGNGIPTICGELLSVAVCWLEGLSAKCDASGYWWEWCPSVRHVVGWCGYGKENA